MDSFIITMLEALKAVSDRVSLLSELTEVNNWQLALVTYEGVSRPMAVCVLVTVIPWLLLLLVYGRLV
jgi:hypothetical protein